MDTMIKQPMIIFTFSVCTLIRLKCFQSQATCCGQSASNSRCPHTHTYFLHANIFTVVIIHSSLHSYNLWYTNSISSLTRLQHPHWPVAVSVDGWSGLRDGSKFLRWWNARGHLYGEAFSFLLVQCVGFRSIVRYNMSTFKSIKMAGPWVPFRGNINATSEVGERRAVQLVAIYNCTIRCT